MTAIYVFLFALVLMFFSLFVELSMVITDLDALIESSNRITMNTQWIAKCQRVYHNHPKGICTHGY